MSSNLKTCFSKSVICAVRKLKEKKQENLLEDDLVLGWGVLWNTDGYSGAGKCAVSELSYTASCPVPQGRSRNRVADKSRKTAVS